MKKAIFAALLMVFAFGAHAQFKWGAKVGLGTTSLKPESLGAAGDSIKLGIQEAKYGYYFGVFTQFKLGSLSLQPEILFNSNRVDYNIKNSKTPIKDSIKTERYNRVDIPILASFKLGPLRAKVGPVAHLNIGSSSELKDVKGYSEKWKQAQWGYQAGVGLNFSQKLHLDIRYEGNFDKWGNHIVIGGKTYEFAQNAPSRWLVNVGYAF